MIYNVQVHLNPRWRLIIARDACAAFWKLNKLNKDVSLWKSFKFSISLSMVMMKHSSRQFDDYFSGFGRQSKKCSRIGACIRRNFTPCFRYYSLTASAAFLNHWKAVSLSCLTAVLPSEYIWKIQVIWWSTSTFAASRKWNLHWHWALLR